MRLIDRRKPDRPRRDAPAQAAGRRPTRAEPESNPIAVGRPVRLWHDAAPGEVVGEFDGTFVVRWSDTGSVTRHHAKDLEAL